MRANEHMNGKFIFVSRNNYIEIIILIFILVIALIHEISYQTLAFNRPFLNNFNFNRLKNAKTDKTKFETQKF